MKIKRIIYLLLAMGLISGSLNSCKKDNPKPENSPSTTNTNNNNEDKELNYPFILNGEESQYKFEVDGQEYSGEVRVVNSLNSEYFIPIELMKSYANAGGIDFLPKKTGTFVSGDKLSNIEGSATSDAKITMSIKVDGKMYYAYSSNPYANTEEDFLPGTEAVITVKKFKGDYVLYEILGYNVKSFIGDVDFLFEGTFKTKNGDETIVVKKGECRIHEELPAGAEIIE